MDKLIRLDPGHLLAHDLGLVIDAFDRQKHFSQAFAHHHIEVEFPGQSLADFDVFVLDFESLVVLKGGEEVDQTEGVVQIPDGVHKGRVPFLDQMFKVVVGGVFPEVGMFGHVSSDLGLLDFFEVGPDFSEPAQQFLVGQEVDVFHVVIGLSVPGFLLRRFSRVDTLQDAQTTEVLKL